MIVGVLGAGGGGLSAAVELLQGGHVVRLWNRSPKALEPHMGERRINYTGVLGSGSIEVPVISTDVNEVLSGADVVLVCLPTLAHRAVAELLLGSNNYEIPVVLNPGHTGGALEFCEVFRLAGKPAPPIAEFSTLTYVARKSDPATVAITGSAKRVWVAALPGGKEAIEIAQAMYPAATLARDVLATGLSNVNMVLHPPGAVLGAAWVESTAGNFTFYVEGLPPGVGRIMEKLDNERLLVAAAYDHHLPTLFEEMQAIGTIESDTNPEIGLAAAVRGGSANQKIKAPDSLSHRYYVEDFCYGLQPFLVLASIADVSVPVARSLMMLANTFLGGNNGSHGRTAISMGIEGLNRNQLVEKIRA